MGDRRKLQAEIDRCLRKVTEGVEIFEDIWQKVHSAPNHNQKDKYEQELKKEIKKLQRLRDQIKTWLSAPEIKDKKQLQEARKNIEQQMERFKVVERETKTKAYSKEGLGAGAKLDPQEKEKEECTHWIRDALQELQIQIDKCEADIETLSASLKKKKSDRDKQERLEETKHTIERHKFHIESLEKILRAIDNDAIDLKPIHNLRDDVEYYIESNQESDFEENELMYEEIDLDNLSTIMAPVIAIPATTTTTTPSYSSSLSNGASSSLNTHSTLSDISSSTYNIQSHSLPNHSHERSNTNSHNTDNESNIDLTTPSSTQPSSPSASPALSATDDRKRNKSESEDNQSQRNRANSGANGSSTTSNSHGSSPKNPFQLQQQSPNVSNSTKTSSLFNYPTSTQPVLQYSTIVSQNSSSVTTPPTSTTTNNNNNNNTSSSTSKQPTNIQSPQIKQVSRQTSIANNEPTNSTNNLGLLNQQILSNISQISGSSSNNSTVTLANGTTIPSSLYSGPGSTLPSSNIPHQISSSTSLDPLPNTQQSPLLSHTTSENERPTSLLTNGSLEGHSPLDTNINFANLSSTNNTNTSGLSLPSSNITSSFLSNDLSSTNSTGIIGQLPDHHTFRYPLSTLNQSSIQTNRVPLTTAETRMLNRLNSAFAKLPSLLESERQRTNANRIYGRNPIGHTPMVSYYPQTPPTGSDTPEFYYRLAPDTLFFVFYYMEGTRAQYLAAKALKRQSWRFHTKHMMWFQRYEEPKTITDDYEQGTYIFFDYERWQTRKRDNFMF